MGWGRTQAEEDEAIQMESLRMLDTFASVGAERFDMTWTDTAGTKTGFRRGAQLDTLRQSIPAQLAEATRLQHNIIIRPHGAGVTFIQLDDLAAGGVHSVTPASFLTLETSADNYQAWLALPAGDHDDDLARRIRKGAGADPSASGATRLAGSLNFKTKYDPDFPRVRINHSSPGQLTTREQLESLGLVAATWHSLTSATPYRISRGRHLGRGTRWPNYERCIENAPLNHDQTGPDISKADFTYCLLAIDWGRGVEETAARLLEISPKARENGERYAQLTAENAAIAVTRNRSR